MARFRSAPVSSGPPNQRNVGLSPQEVFVKSGAGNQKISRSKAVNWLSSQMLLFHDHDAACFDQGPYLVTCPEGKVPHGINRNS